MKKQFVILACFSVFASLNLTAQNTTTSFPKFNISAGVGLVPVFVADGASASLPPLTLKAGYQVTRNFSVSGFLGYATADSKPGLVSDGKLVYANNSQLVTAIRGEWKMPVGQKFDIYGGGLIGMSRSRIREYDVATDQVFVRQVGAPTPFDPNAKAGQVFYSGFVGGHYFIRKNVGVFLEAGFGVSLLTTGVAVRF